MTDRCCPPLGEWSGKRLANWTGRAGQYRRTFTIMIAAQQISLVFGVLVLFYGLFLGVPIAQERATARQAN
jgi:hypothetical protein